LIVVDASAILEVLLQTPAAMQVSTRVFAPGETLHAPHLLDIEIAHALRRYARSAVISSQRGREALADLADMPIYRYPHAVLFPRIWELRNVLTAYDAAYLALAEALDAPLITRDRALAYTGAKISIELL
jgi:predicted nucleic acid-binding protein